MPPMTRGPLPPGVYWRRRVFVLALAGALVFVVAGWLDGSSDGSSSGDPVAEQAGAVASQTVTVPSRKERRAERRQPRATAGPTYDPGVLVRPEGTCEAADVLVTPEVGDAVAGRPVTIGLSLQTRESAACTWRLNPSRVTLTIRDGDREIWTSRDCPGAIPEQTVVVRRVVATVVETTWNARESDDRCPAATDWVRWGDYTIGAAALGGEPAEEPLDLASPQPEIVTESPEEEDDGDRRGGDDVRRKPAEQGEPTR